MATVAPPHALVLLETSSNQDYIYASNRLRENLGASELVRLAGTAWGPAAAAEAARAAGGPAIEILLTLSGKTIALAGSEALGRAMVQHATLRALRDAPGLDLRGVVLPLTRDGTAQGARLTPETCSAAEMHGAILRLYGRFEARRGRTTGPAQRLPGLPPQARCASTGMPAAAWVAPRLDPAAGDAPRAAAAATLAKLRAVEPARVTLSGIALAEALGRYAPANLDALLNAFEAEEGRDGWLGIVHADGNGVGQIFMGFDAMLPPDTTGRGYLTQMADFSRALDRASIVAFQQAVASVTAEGLTPPVLPIVSGGDDMTAIVIGRQALRFTAAYLRAFEAATAAAPAVSALAEKAFGVPRLSACAGVAVVKARYPFHLGYQLSEDLLQAAKRPVKRILRGATGHQPAPCSALDFHIHYDSTGGSLAQIRALMTLPGEVRLHGRPYVVTGRAQLEQAGVAAAGLEWAARHHIARLAEAARDCRRVDKDEEEADEAGQLPLPNGQLHALRQALFAGPAVADAALRAIWPRYSGRTPLGGVVQGDARAVSLFLDDPELDAASAGRMTRLFDGIDVARLELIDAPVTA